jgi:hypothetical protein
MRVQSGVESVRLMLVVGMVIDIRSIVILWY